jgi:hypothetical protein
MSQERFCITRYRLATRRCSRGRYRRRSSIPKIPCPQVAPSHQPPLSGAGPTASESRSHANANWRRELRPSASSWTRDVPDPGALHGASIGFQAAGIFGGAPAPLIAVPLAKRTSPKLTLQGYRGGPEKGPAREPQLDERGQQETTSYAAMISRCHTPKDFHQRFHREIPHAAGTD